MIANDERYSKFKPKTELHLHSEDNYVIHCSRDDVRASFTLRDLMATIDESERLVKIRLPFDFKTLQGVVWWLKNHKDVNEIANDVADNWPDKAMDEWELGFFRIDPPYTLALIRAAKYLGIGRLRDLGTRHLLRVVSEHLNDRNPVESIRDAFGVPEPAVRNELEDNSPFVPPKPDNTRRQTQPKYTEDLLEVVHLPPRRQICPDKEFFDKIADEDDN